MMDDIEKLRIRTKLKQKTLRRLGVESACCSECGEDDAECFEKDHIAGRHHSGELRTLCLNCHRKRTARQQTEHPPVGPDPKNDFEVAARFLLADVDYQDANSRRKLKLVVKLLRLAKRGITDVGE